MSFSRNHAIDWKLFWKLFPVMSYLELPLQLRTHHKSKQKYGQLYVTKADVQQSKFCNYVSESVL